MIYIINHQETDSRTPIAIYLDRDGVLNEKIENGYVLTKDQLVIRDNAAWFLRECFQITPYVFIVSNQRCVDLGIITLQELTEIDAHLWELLRYKPFASIYATTNDRKPSPSMIFKARELVPVELEKELMFGDSLSDQECAENAGVEFSMVWDSLPVAFSIGLRKVDLL